MRAVKIIINCIIALQLTQLKCILFINITLYYNWVYKWQNPQSNRLRQ
jgi:hypothetical protein